MIEMKKPLTRLALFVGVCAVAIQTASAQYYQFTNIFPLEGVPGYPISEMIANCGGEYEDAAAHMWLWQRQGQSFVILSVKNVPPNEIFTVWLKLQSGSPLTGAGVTALANPDEIAALAEITPDSVLTETAHDLGLQGDDGSGGVHAANAFRTNRRGNGLFVARLNFPIIKGAYPFHEFDESLSPVAIGPGPFTLRIASHCTDHVAHGLVAGKHEMFLDWTFDE